MKFSNSLFHSISVSCPSQQNPTNFSFILLVDGIYRIYTKNLGMNKFLKAPKVGLALLILDNKTVSKNRKWNTLDQQKRNRNSPCNNNSRKRKPLQPDRSICGCSRVNVK